ncbi:MAG TPA: YjfI family protein [Marinagarivorans sp.]
MPKKSAQTPKATSSAEHRAPKSSAYYQREFRKRLREQGLVKKEAWIIPANGKLLSLVEKELRFHIEAPTIGNAGQLVGDAMLAHNPPSWTIGKLYEALLTTDLATHDNATFNLLDEGHSLEIILHELGDLPLLLTIAGQQMLVEAVLWAVDDVADTAQFDAAILRTHKYFPLSTIGIETYSDGNDYYTVFGALSTNSLLANIVLEIETLGANVIQAANAYSHFLRDCATSDDLLTDHTDEPAL